LSKVGRTLMAEKPSPNPATICSDCHGTGRLDGGECVVCAGSGVIVERVGGA